LQPEPPAVAGIGSVGGFQFILQDSGRNTFGDTTASPTPSSVKAALPAPVSPA